MPDGPRLQDLRGRTHSVTCPLCPRAGGIYQTAHLCRVLGPETALADALLRISARCSHQRRVGSRRPNGLGQHCQAGITLEPVDERGEVAEGFSRPLSYAPFRIDSWGPGGALAREVALVTDLKVAHETLAAAARRFPDEPLTLR